MTTSRGAAEAARRNPSAAGRAIAAGRTAAARMFGRLPPRIRRAVVGWGTASYTVGSVVVVHDGPLVLLLTQAHNPRVALPGGLLDRNERGRPALARELAEELGNQAAELVMGLAAPVPDTANVDPRRRGVDLIWVVPMSAADLPIAPGADIGSVHWWPADHPDIPGPTRDMLDCVRGRLGS